MILMVYFNVQVNNLIYCNIYYYNNMKYLCDLYDIKDVSIELWKKEYF